MRTAHFSVSVPSERLAELVDAVKASPLPPPFYEGETKEQYLGIPSSWMREAKERWINGYDWCARLPPA